VVQLLCCHLCALVLAWAANKVSSSWPPWPSSVHIITLNYLIILFCREFALHGVFLLPLAHALALGGMGRP
jgi:hypothetical protein